MGSAPRRIGLYSPYFGSVFGGGEKYLACAAAAIRDAAPAAAVEVASPVAGDRAATLRMLGVDLAGIGLRSTNRRVTPAHRALNRVRLLRPLRDRVLGGQAARAGAGYDVFLPMVYAIPVRPSGRRNVMLCQFPYRGPGDEIAGFDLIVCQSEYVRRWVREYWARDAAVVNPPIDVPAAAPSWDAKRPVILSVGRFFSGGHGKRQDVLVAVFKAMVDAGLAPGWRLHLAGGVHRDAQHRGYFESVVASARGYPIEVHPDLDGEELRELYASASVYWHAAGYEADAEAEPERFEHFGMATAEAMAHGAVPVVFGAGGQLEVVRDGVDGRHWDSPDELQAITSRLLADPKERRRLGGAAREASRRWSRPAFNAAITSVLSPYLGPVPAAA